MSFTCRSLASLTPSQAVRCDDYVTYTITRHRHADLSDAEWNELYGCDWGVSDPGCPQDKMFKAELAKFGDGTTDWLDLLVLKTSTNDFSVHLIAAWGWPDQFCVYHDGIERPFTLSCEADYTSLEEARAEFNRRASIITDLLDERARTATSLMGGVL